MRSTTDTTAAPAGAVPAGILAGILVWGFHGVLEYALLTLPAIQAGGAVLPPSFVQSTLVLLCGYVVAGIITGALGGLLLRGERVSFADVPPALALTLGFSGYTLAARAGGVSDYLLLSVILAGQLLLLARPGTFGSLRFLSRPVLLNVLLLSRPLAEQLFDGRRNLVRALVVLATAAFGIAWLSKRPIRNARALIAPSTAVLAVLAIYAAVSTSTAQSPSPAAVAAQSAAERQMPNVVLIVMDTVRADHMSTYGYSRPTTPSLSKFAERATLFTNAFAVSDMTLPTHSSLFTGKYPEWHGAHYVRPDAIYGVPLKAEHQTLAEVLSAAGYTSVASVANSGYVNRNFGMGQGFHVFDARRVVPPVDPHRPAQFSHGVRQVLSWLLDTADFDRATLNAAEINADVVRLLQSSSTRRPVFLFLNYMEAHVPYVPPSTFREKYPGRDRHFTALDFYSLREKVLSLKGSVTEEERNHLVSQYDAAIESLDAEIGRLFDNLQSMGILDNALVIITSDHGEAFGNKSLLEHSVGLYQDEIRVPMLIRLPGQQQATVIARPVSQVDVMPTVLSALSLSQPSGVQGRNILDGSFPDKPLFAVSYEPYMSNYHKRLQRTERMVVSGGLKLIRSTAGKQEMYDLNSDALEDKNVYNSRPEDAQRLQKLLDEHLQAAPRPGRTPQGGRAVDKQTLDRLKSLGYVQ